MQDLIAAAVARELRVDEPELVARMVAASLMGALMTAEESAAKRTAASGRALSEREVDRLLDATMAFIEGGLERLGAGPPR
jgi:MftR C-terminal domain